MPTRLRIGACFLLILAGCALPQRSPDSSENAVTTIETDSAKVEIQDQEITEEASDLPKDMNQYVLRQMEYFLGRGRHHMEKYLARGPRYLAIVQQTLRDEGVPEDLAYLALIESGFNPIAKSHARAVGYWQFIKGTGKRYGLRIDNYVDERRDPIKSTVAAARYLKALYNLFGSWHLALAAYNVGENRIKSQVMRHETRDLWELIRTGRLPVETKHYVPKFIAAKIIAKHKEKYGFDKLPFEEPYRFEVVRVEQPISLRLLANNLGLSHSEMKLHNPMYKTDYVPVSKGGFAELRLPVEKVAMAPVAISKSYVRSAPRVVAQQIEDIGGGGYVYYRVKRGENLSVIANKFRTSISRLRSLNNLGSRSRIVAGSRLKVPSMQMPRPDSYKSIQKQVKNKVHVVRRGETLWDISKRYRVSLADIRRENKFNSGTNLLIGSRLVIPD